ncbi:MAG: hypothetical protein QG553_657 [Patescibacteria group bacterium]|nr:hypothetical protein [Patescibacteria group bacterium]
MAIIEADMQQLDSEVVAGQQLAFARQELAELLEQRQPDAVGVLDCTATYVNAFQKYHFEAHPTVTRRSLQNPALLLKLESEALLGYSIECVEDIENRLANYRQDDVAKDLRAQGISPIPRAFTMTILDIIDEYSGRL